MADLHDGKEGEAVRVIVVRDGRLLLMRRNKFGLQYYTLVGGHIEAGETPLAAMLREVREETGLRLRHPRQVYLQEPVGRYNRQYVYTAEYAGGEIRMHPEADEQSANRQGDNTYEPLWVPLDEVADLPLFPHELKVQLMQDLRHGFPAGIISVIPKGD